MGRKKINEAMYNLLDSKSKSETDHDTFVNKYTNIYNGIEADQLKIETKDIVDGDGGKTAAYHFSADTLAGNVSLISLYRLSKKMTPTKSAGVMPDIPTDAKWRWHSDIQ